MRERRGRKNRCVNRGKTIKREKIEIEGENEVSNGEAKGIWIYRKEEM